MRKFIIISSFSMIGLIINCCFICNRMGDESYRYKKVYTTILDLKNETNLYIDIYFNNQFMCSSSPETNVECKVSLIYDILLGYTQNQFKEDREKIEKEACYFSISYIRHTITKKTLEGYITVNMLEETKGELLNIEARSFELHKTIFNDTLTLPLYPTEAIHTIYIK